MSLLGRETRDGDGKVGNSLGPVSIAPNAAGVGTGVDRTLAYDCCGVDCGVSVVTAKYSLRLPRFENFNFSGLSHTATQL